MYPDKKKSKSSSKNSQALWEKMQSRCASLRLDYQRSPVFTPLAVQTTCPRPNCVHATKLLTLRRHDEVIYCNFMIRQVGCAIGPTLCGIRSKNLPPPHQLINLDKLRINLSLACRHAPINLSSTSNQPAFNLSLNSRQPLINLESTSSQPPINLN